MISTELYIDYELADQSDQNPVAINFQVNDLADLQDRQSTFSQTIKLPKTSTNKRLLGYADSDSFTTNIPYTKPVCKYVVNGVEVISHGAIVLQQVSDYFETQLTFGVVGINDLLKITETNIVTGEINVRDAKLTDLDWSDIPNFNFDVATIVASQSSSDPNNVLWPLIDYGGTLDSSAIIDATYLRPGIFCNQIITRIQKFLGYVFSGSIMSDTKFLTDFIPFSATVLYDYQGTVWRTTMLPLSVAKNLPDITIKDFLKDLMQRYFLTPIVDNYAKTLIFRNFDELYDNKSISKDWTDKFIDDARTDEFALPNYAQINFLYWKKDVLNMTNGNGSISVNNTTLPLNTVLITSIYAASAWVTVLGGQNVASIKKFPTSPLPNSGIIPTIDTETRIVNIRRAVGGTYDFHIIDDHIFTSGPVYIGLFNDQGTTGIGYDNQLKKYGSGLLNLLKKCRVITRYVTLKPADLYQFDFFTPLYDRKEAKYYYCNLINNYVPGVKTKISLIRM